MKTAAAALLLSLAACTGHDSTVPSSAPVATISLTATAVVVMPAETLHVTATPKDAAGNPVTGKTVTWTSSNPAVATIDANGTVTALSSGVTTLIATIDGKTASVTITVGAPAPPPPPPPPPLSDTVASLGPWTLVYNRPLVSKYEGVSFPDSLHGWVISDRGEVLNSSDGGVTWALQATLNGHLRSLDFIDANRGFIGTLGGVLYRTTDGGVTWTDITSAMPKAPIGFCGITHVGNRVHVVGRYQSATDYFMSPDGGNTWQYQSMAAFAQGLVEVTFLNDSIGFIGGTAKTETAVQGPATILRTSDGGATWRTVFLHDGGPGWAWKIFPTSATVIYAAIESLDGIYRVAKSFDAGEEWSVQIVDTGQPLGASGGLQWIGFLDDRVGWVGGFFPGMYATTNGGVTWTSVPMTSKNINRFRRVGNTLFTAGTQGVLRYDARH